MACACGRNTSHMKRFNSCPAVGGTVTCCCVDDFVNFVSKGCVVSIVFCLRNNWMSAYILPSIGFAAVAAVTMAQAGWDVPNITEMWAFLFPADIWDPILAWMWPGFAFAWLMFWVMAITYVTLLYGEKTYTFPGAWNPWVIFWVFLTLFVVFLVIAWYISPVKLFGVEIVSTTPNTCVGQKSSLEAGLCYNNCKPGYHGSMTGCYADSVNVGSGTAFGMTSCPKDDGDGTHWVDFGLTCTRWKHRCREWGTDIIGHWWTGCAETVNLAARCPGPYDFGGNYKDEYDKWDAARQKPDRFIDPETKLPESDEVAAMAGHKTSADIAYIGTDKHTSMVDGMCYKECPPEYPVRIPGMPYLCYKGGPLSYDRGIGDAPRFFRLFGKYAFPPFG